jgi:hypothetical protein
MASLQLQLAGFARSDFALATTHFSIAIQWRVMLGGTDFLFGQGLVLTLFLPMLI